MISILYSAEKIKAFGMCDRIIRIEILKIKNLPARVPISFFFIRIINFVYFVKIGISDVKLM